MYTPKKLDNSVYWEMNQHNSLCMFSVSYQATLLNEITLGERMKQNEIFSSSWSLYERIKLGHLFVIPYVWNVQRRVGLQRQDVC